jgi:hypothetical protein
MEITADFEVERPGAVRALREVYRIPPEFEVIVQPHDHVRFWGPGITAQQARPFYLADIRAAVEKWGGPYHCSFCNDWDTVLQ